MANPKHRWWEEKENDPEKKFWDKDKLRMQLENSLQNKLRPNITFHLSDNNYFLPPLKNAEEIISKTKVYNHEYVQDLYDCDDFAYILKAHFIEAGYKNFERRAPYCFGIAWGQLGTKPGIVHAINWMFINEDDEIHFIEPQTGEIYPPRDSDHDISFILA